MSKDIDVCSNYRPYAQAIKTIHFGCVNCGKGAYSHPNYCRECQGTGRGANEKNEPDDFKSCPVCSGSGRNDGKYGT